jgi:hypothetical protein
MCLLVRHAGSGGILVLPTMQRPASPTPIAIGPPTPAPPACLPACSCAAEILGWVGFTVATQTAAAALFTLVGAGQMAQWALGKHKRLLKVRAMLQLPPQARSCMCCLPACSGGGGGWACWRLARALLKCSALHWRLWS